MAESKLSSIFKDKSLLSQISEGEPAPLNMQILMDADGFVAIVKEDDTNHRGALDVMNRLEKRGVLFLITPFTIPESATVLSYKVSHEVACEFLREVRTLSLEEFGILEFNEKIKQRTDEVFVREQKKRTSYFDCVNIACMERYHLDAIFSFDKVYRAHNLRYAEEL